MKQLWPASVWDELEREVAELRLYLVEKRMNALVEEVFRDLERRYRPDQPRAPKGTPEGGQWVVDPAGARQRQQAERGERLSVTWMPMGFTKHGINQTINRGISAGAIYDALNNPNKIAPGSSPHSWKYYGIDAVVVINPFGEIITLWPT
ncbi:hypothetical protein [Devosia geojensis]|uniref:hypothetical protein n=1 Tax=Devosia geojensis TaxID=443610 RepID=UPI00069677D6|nr:hypothetical protein [Devosia geojensis]